MLVFLSRFFGQIMPKKEMVPEDSNLPGLTPKDRRILEWIIETESPENIGSTPDGMPTPFSSPMPDIQNVERDSPVKPKQGTNCCWGNLRRNVSDMTPTSKPPPERQDHGHKDPTNDGKHHARKQFKLSHYHAMPRRCSEQ